MKKLRRTKKLLVMLLKYLKNDTYQCIKRCVRSNICSKELYHILCAHVQYIHSVVHFTSSKIFSVDRKEKSKDRGRDRRRNRSKDRGRDRSRDRDRGQEKHREKRDGDRFVYICTLYNRVCLHV